MSNKELKHQLHAKNPRCHWCKRETKLIDTTNIKNRPDPLMATIDHKISRYHPKRWVAGVQQKVLACYECNQKRAVAETMALSRAELVRRSQGFNLNPKGKPVIEKPLPTLDDVLAKLAERGIIPK